MKRTLSILTCIMLFISTFMSIAYADTDDSIEDKRIYHNVFNAVYTYDNLPTLKIEAYFDDNPELLQSIEDYYEYLLSRIPKEFTDKMKEHNIVVLLVDDCRDYWGYNPPKFLQGFYNPSNNRVFISIDNDEYAFSALDRTLYHELGHTIDSIYGNKSASREFKQHYREEAGNLLTGAPSDPCEFFAYLFHLYMWSYDSDYELDYGKQVFTELCKNSGDYLFNVLNLDNPWKIDSLIINCPIQKRIHRIIKNVISIVQKEV